MINRHIGAVLLFALTGLAPRDSGATTAVNVVLESVNNYATTNCTPTNNCATCNYAAGDLCNSNANNAGFLTGLTTSFYPFPASFSQGTLHSWQDGAVYDTDFYDYQLGTPASDDMYFDRPGTHISYFTGHGWSLAGYTPQTCTTSSTCTNTNTNIGSNPPGSLRLPGTCLASPNYPVGTGQCVYTQDRKMIVNGSTVRRGNNVWYGGGFTSSYQVAFGESSQSGTWRGAGTNGGTNLVVLDMSWPSIPAHEWDSLAPLLAGAHMVAVTQPVQGDQINVSDRGFMFGLYAAINPNGAVFQAWRDTLNSLSQYEGAMCGSSWSVGGGHGFWGCGCNLAMTADLYNSWAQYHTTETWQTLVTSTVWDAEGRNYYYWAATCNYSGAFTTYPWAL